MGIEVDKPQTKLVCEQKGYRGCANITRQVGKRPVHSQFHCLFPICCHAVASAPVSAHKTPTGRKLSPTQSIHSQTLPDSKDTPRFGRCHTTPVVNAMYYCATNEVTMHDVSDRSLTMTTQGLSFSNTLPTLQGDTVLQHLVDRGVSHVVSMHNNKCLLQTPRFQHAQLKALGDCREYVSVRLHNRLELVNVGHVATSLPCV